MRLLRSAPNTILWLQNYPDYVMQNLVGEAQRYDIFQHRLVFAAPYPRPKHLARLALADIYLDAPWYNAHTTMMDVLYQGCPVVTVRGESVYGRISSSILTFASLPELIADDVDDYIDIALEFVRDERHRHEVKTRVKALRDAPLFNATSHIRTLERGYEQLLERHGGGQPLRDIYVEAIDR
jgi:predicted O-linked N-acetylglucosamine transferase (SPINDLY family)